MNDSHALIIADSPRSPRLPVSLAEMATIVKLQISDLTCAGYVLGTAIRCHNSPQSEQTLQITSNVSPPSRSHLHISDIVVHHAAGTEFRLPLSLSLSPSLTRHHSPYLHPLTPRTPTPFLSLTRVELNENIDQQLTNTQPAAHASRKAEKSPPTRRTDAKNRTIRLSHTS